MSYVEQKGTQSRKTAIIGVVAIHALMGTALVTGLAPQIIDVIDPPPPPTTFDVEDKKPPPPPETKPETDRTIAQAPDPYAPTPEIDVNTYDPAFDTSIDLPDFSDTIITNVPATGNETIAPTPSPLPSFDPVAARPSNDASRWVTTRDYKRSWINREMTGMGRFAFTVGTNGRVQDCRVLSSTGHPALDNATCRLVTRRAKFDAARNGNGEKVPGNYTTSIRWQLPD